MADTSRTTLGKRIEWARREREGREGREISSATLSYRMFCPERTVDQWELDIGRPSDEELALLAQLLDVDPSWLATGELASNGLRRRIA